MVNDTEIKRIHQILDRLHANSTQSTDLHKSFLNHQACSIQSLLKNETPAFQQIIKAKQFVFSKEQLQEFGNGSIAKCFGQDFEILDHRRTPRIPNGDLLMIDRVLSISGVQGSFKAPAKITTEIDIYENAWFLEENQYTGIPFGILMEIALQPCGILSAYLGTSLSLPPEVNLFRNLDGEISLSKFPQFINETITNHSSLLSSVSGGGMLIQKYSFELSIDKLVFLKGNSSFGYFTQSVMENQSGIDASKLDSTLGKTGQVLNRNTSLQPKTNSHKPHLDLIDSISFHENGGKYGNGLIVGEKKLSGNEWFFENHFFQDPVMPGSLGIEAIIQGLLVFAKNSKSEFITSYPIIDFSNKDPIIWKYRGQVLPENKNLHFEIHLKHNLQSNSSMYLLVDADFWIDEVKIYTVQDISINIGEGD